MTQTEPKFAEAEVVMSYTAKSSTVKITKRKIEGTFTIDVNGKATEVEGGIMYTASIEDVDDFFRKTSWFVSKEQDATIGKDDFAKEIFERISFLFLFCIKAYERDFRKHAKVIE